MRPIGVGIVGTGRISDLHAIEYSAERCRADRGGVRSGAGLGDD